MACSFQRIYFDLTISMIGMILGFLAWITFIVLENYEAGFLACFSGVLALNVFNLHRYQKKGTLCQWSAERFDRYELSGFVGILAGSSFMIWYLFLELYYKTPVLPVNQSVVIRLVWAFMTFKWGTLLYMAVKKYSKLFEDARVLVNNIIINEE